MLLRQRGLSGKVSLEGTVKKEKGFDCVYFGRNGGEMNLTAQKYASSLHIIENPAFSMSHVTITFFSVLKCGVVPPESVVSRPQ